MECDPQLSRPNGLNQAKMTASHLQNLLVNEYKLTEDTEYVVFSSPSLVCIETACALMSQFKVKELTVKDELADILMKSWYCEDPFPGWITKLVNN